MKCKSEYVIPWEFERDLFLFDTILYPYFRQKKMNRFSAFHYCKKKKPKWYKILNRLKKDAVGKEYLRFAFKLPKEFADELLDKYKHINAEEMAKTKKYSIDTYDEDLTKMLEGEI